MKNSEYEKMPRSFKGLNEKQSSELAALRWVVTEKLHGANFSFVYENGQLRYAKRKEYLCWEDDFFGFQLVVSRLETSILRLFEQLSLDIIADSYILYGELLGGKYPHPAVEAQPDLQPIQTGVYYSPDLLFCAFDIATIQTETKSYLDYHATIDYCQRFGVFYAEPLFIGKLNEALEFNTLINSTIPQKLGLPALADNLIEGVVIKPIQHSQAQSLAQRPIIKLKNAAFEEEEKFHDAQKWSFIPDVRLQSEDVGFLLEALGTYINTNRINSAISKIGNLDKTNPKRMEAIEQEVLQDTINDFNINNNRILDELEEGQKQWLSERVLFLITLNVRKKA